MFLFSIERDLKEVSNGLIATLKGLTMNIISPLVLLVKYHIN